MINFLRFNPLSRLDGMMSEKFNSIFEEGTIGSLNIPNRIVMPPMGTLTANIDGTPSDQMINYYAERAKGGAGLIIVEIAGVDFPESQTTSKGLRLDKDKFIPDLGELTERIHDHGSKTFLQLQHPGRQTTPNVIEGKQPVSASEVTETFSGVTPRKLETEEVEELVDKYVQAAVRAERAGFDGVQLHGGHGYLITQFISSRTNKRSDKYGGDIKDRCKFPKEIINGIREELGEDFPVEIRISVDEFVEGGHGVEESKVVAQELEKAGVDSINASAATYESFPQNVEPMRFEESWRTYLAEELKKVVDIPVAAVGVIRKPETANQIIQDGRADFVAIGRGLISDPYWPKKAAKGEVEKINKCISCNTGCVGRVLDERSVGCAINPTVGKEEIYNNLGEAQNIKDVLVIGGGPGGMEAAKYAAERGHNVTLYEKDEELGGQLKIAKTPPGKDKIKWFLDYMKQEMDRLDIKVSTGVEVDKETIELENPDSIIVATGAEPIEPDIKNDENVLQAWDVLKQEMDIENEEILMIGGGQVGCELTEYLVEKNNEVTILEMLDDIASDMEMITKVDLIQRFTEEENIEWRTNEKVKEINSTKVKVENEGEEKSYTADKVILAMGSKSQKSLVNKLDKEKYNIFLVGDAEEPNKIYEATQTGAKAGISIGVQDPIYSPINY